MNRSRLALHFELLISKFHRVVAEISALEIESISRISPINPALEAAPALTLRQHFQPSVRTRDAKSPPTFNYVTNEWYL